MYIYLGLLASVIGLGLSSYIYRKKFKKSKLYCPLRMKGCDKVVNSAHGKSFGVPKELLGILYYVLTGLTFAAALVFPGIISGIAQELLVLLVTIGVLFSIHLILLQAFIIRAWCIWCLLSAIANLMLAISLLGFPRVGVMQLIISQQDFWLAVHNISLAVTLIATLLLIISFLRTMKRGLVNAILNIAWIMLSALIVSIVMFAIPQLAFPLRYVVEGVGVLIIAGSLLMCNIYIS